MGDGNKELLGTELWGNNRVRREIIIIIRSHTRDDEQVKVESR